jgi:hypothetical protein
MGFGEVQRFLKFKPGFRLFEGCGPVLAPGSYSQKTLKTILKLYVPQHHQHHLNLLLSNIPYQGGGDYRGIYDIGLKRGCYGV